MVDSATREILLLIGYVAIAFVPPVVYLVWIRNLETHAREPWKGLLKAFAWGAVGGVILALVLESLIGARPDAAPLGFSSVFYMAVIVAPVVEEFTKALGLRWVRDDHLEREDGLIYGAAAGLGFAATENLMYQTVALLQGGLSAFVLTIAIRTIAATLLHGSASALVGHGIWRARRGIGGFGGILGFYALAVLLHAAYNYAASMQVLAGLAVALLLSVFVARMLVKRVNRLDAHRGAGTPRV